MSRRKPQVSNLAIWQSAKQLLDCYNETALKEAVNRVEEARKVGDAETEAVWVRVAQAVSELQRIKPDEGSLQ